MTTPLHALLAPGATMLVLPNAWDALSARLVERAGAAAVATTSAAVAWKAGYADGQRAPFEEHERTVAAMARVVGIPITADLERGYSDSPEEVATLVERVVKAGAYGVNLEDGHDPELLVAKIRAVKTRLGDRVFVNARSDATSDHALHAALFAGAGADGFFAIRLTDEAEIRALVKATPLPVNLVEWPNLPPRAKLRDIGVRRLSAGPNIARAAYGAANAAVREMLGGAAPNPLTYSELNGLF